MKLTALLTQERREGREEGGNVFYSSLKCKKRIPTSCLLTVCGVFAIIPASTTLDNNQFS